MAAAQPPGHQERLERQAIAQPIRTVQIADKPAALDQIEQESRLTRDA
jgi:hypothetical protein